MPIFGDGKSGLTVGATLPALLADKPILDAGEPQIGQAPASIVTQWLQV